MHRNDGFTLLEILIVVMLIGSLMALVATQLFSRGERARIDAAAMQVSALSSQLELYRLDNGRYPTTEQGLEALVREPVSDPRPRSYNPGGYLKAAQIRDPWQTPFRYQVPGSHNSHSFDLWSFGPDGLEGGAGDGADIVNWDTGTLQ